MKTEVPTFVVFLAICCGCSSNNGDVAKSRVAMGLGELPHLEERNSKRRQEYLQSIRDASSDEQRKAIAREFSADWRVAVDEMLKIAEQEPSTPAGKRAALWVVRSCDEDIGLHRRAAELLLREHANAEEMAGVCQHLTGFSAVYEQLLRKVASSNAYRQCRALSAFELANLLTMRAHFRDIMDGTPELRERRILNLGEHLVPYLEASNPDKDRAEARQLYHRVEREFSDVAYRNGTLGAAASERLMPLEQTYPELGKAAPNIVGNDLTGNSFTLEDYRDHVVVITFWASWCGACLEEVPEKNRLLEEFEGANIQLFGVNGDEAIEDALRATDVHSIRFRSWWDNPAADTKLVEQWRVTAWPTTYVIDQAGTIRYKNLPDKDLRQVVQELLGEKANAQ